MRTHANTLQIGRTHGQHALPITVGFWLATVLDRLLRNTAQLDEAAAALVGKISGAVGAYNAQIGLGIAGRCPTGETFEEMVLDRLFLKPAPISTQILPPEPLANFLFACCLLSASLGQFGRDCRHLMRSEIAEVVEAYEAKQVGSSTMGQKRNPLNLENLEGMWLRILAEFYKVMLTLISEHQRDLVGSSVMRDFPIIVVNLQYQLDTLLRKPEGDATFLSRLTVNPEACKRNFEQSAKFVLAEPLYIALLIAGYEGDAHELVNRTLVPLAQEKGILLIEALEIAAESDEAAAQALESMDPDTYKLLRSPEEYTGSARERALAIAASAEEFIART